MAGMVGTDGRVEEEELVAVEDIEDLKTYIQYEGLKNQGQPDIPTVLYSLTEQCHN